MNDRPTYRVEVIGLDGYIVEAWVEPCPHGGWQPSTTWMEWRITREFNDGAETDVLRGYAKWDGCCGIQKSESMHVCDMNEFSEAWTVIEQLRFELLEDAE